MISEAHHFEWLEVLQGFLGDFLGGFVVTVLFFVIEARLTSDKDARVRLSMLRSAKTEVERISEQASQLALEPQNDSTPLDTGFLRMLVTNAMTDVDVENLGPPLSRLQASADALNGLRSRLLAETVGLASALSGNEDTVGKLNAAVISRAKAVEADCTRFHEILNGHSLHVRPRK